MWECYILIKINLKIIVNLTLILSDLLLCIKIKSFSVSEAEKRINGTLNLREYFTVYLIETVVKNPDFKKISTKLGTIWRRYSEFEQLHFYLEITYPYLILPPLPEKKILFGWQKSGSDTFDPDFVDRRRAGLENFLIRTASHPLLCYDKLFLGFLQQEEGWHELCKETGYLQQTENKLKALAALPSRIKKPDERFEALKDYSNELNTHLQNLLKTRTRLAERYYTIYKLHANYGRVFSEWSAAEKTMGDGLQKAGHFLDSFAASIDLASEEEEVIADQLKQYLFFGASVQAVCKRRDMLQLQLQRAQDYIDDRVNQMEQVQKGKVSFMSRIFGTTDRLETKELRVNAVEQRIQEGKINMKAIVDELNDFTKEALLDYERFDKQKTLDVKETLGNYVGIQIKLSKQGLQTWTHVKECLNSFS
ncbi:Sorting nexin-4, putative [Pediculus humanus corporis]|uniref:Sorting nexin-4, putative n=1 Tax=Pediculus humanus subsp. corporis TaxID=121224 RepID=E0VR31_PEDHC|nr:Sorting nexin-4, putative [Pediculus humanus corporis]EEB15837.1 Sorting nexin-4, putative [Pediculus humanus corporis]